MRIGYVGGLGRHAGALEEAAARAGHSLRRHDGELRPGTPQALQALVLRSDLVVLVTGVNSHGAVKLTRELCRHHGRSVFLTTDCGPTRFRALLAALAVREARLEQGHGML